MDLGLSGRRALVLGSSSGLGRAIASTLADEGARVVVAGRDVDRLQATEAEIGAAGHVAGDITENDVVDRLVAEAAGMLGGLDILIGNTGGGRPGGLLEVTADDEDQGYRRMLRPQLRAARAAIPHLRQGAPGRLVFITARSILEASPELALSSVFRSGVAAAARTLALELAPDVLVNVVVPGQFDTGALERFQRQTAQIEGIDYEHVREDHRRAIPLGRYGTADELAAAVAFLCSSKASYITGTVLRVDGGSVKGF
jgi:NAD(P)-dependent dehydrogenase (short-subunit alcohol dehydrogenase family)